MVREQAFYDRMTASTYVLVPLGERPFAGGSYVAVSSREAVHVVCRALWLEPNHQLLRTLGLRHAPRRCEALERAVADTLRGIPRWQLLRQVVMLRSSELRTTPVLERAAPVSTAKKPTS